MKPFDLKVGEWWQVPRVGNSQLADVYATPNPGGGQQNVMATWSGACIDTKRKEMLIFGGGHTDYTGNEVYAFNFDPLSANYLLWRVKAYYSTPLNNDAESNADGSPSSRHSYAGLAYSLVRDKMIVAPGGFLAGPSGNRAIWTWEFDCTTESPSTAAPSAWTRKDDAPAISPSAADPRCNISYNAANGLYYCQHRRGLATFDPAAAAASQWVPLTNFEGPVIGDDSCAVAPLTPSQLIFTGTAASGQAFGRQLDTNAYIGSETTGLPVTGDINILDVAVPGIGWDPYAQRMVIWGGTATGGIDNRDVYSLNLTTKVVTRISGSGATPDNPTANGTFGRWACLGDIAGYEGLFILVNTTTSHVYFYRSSFSPPGPPAAAARSLSNLLGSGNSGFRSWLNPSAWW